LWGDTLTVTWKQTVLLYFKVLSRRFSAGSEDNNEIFVHPLPGPVTPNTWHNSNHQDGLLISNEETALSPCLTTFKDTLKY
jgi:hypothetical protein